MSKHVYHDGKGEVRIYSALPGCTCSWCTDQRREYQLKSSTAKKFSMGTDDSDESGVLLAQYAAEQARKRRIPLSVAMAEARQLFPAVASRAYAQDDDGAPNADADRSPEEAGEKLHKLAVERMRDAKVEYAEALRQAMVENPSLALAWRNISTHAKRR